MSLVLWNFDKDLLQCIRINVHMHLAKLCYEVAAYSVCPPVREGSGLSFTYFIFFLVTLISFIIFI